MATIESLMTAEDYQLLPDFDRPTELVQGKLVMMNMPGFRHGKICLNVGWALTNFARENDLGHVLSNDSGIITQRAPDTVRGADISFYSYARLQKDAAPVGYPGVSPELVVEVLSPGDRWSEVYQKVAEYLKANVLMVLVVDPEQQRVHLYENEQPPREFAAGDQLELTGVLDGFSVRVATLFE